MTFICIFYEHIVTEKNKSKHKTISNAFFCLIIKTKNNELLVSLFAHIISHFVQIYNIHISIYICIYVVKRTNREQDCCLLSANTQDIKKKSIH